MTLERAKEKANFFREEYGVVFPVTRYEALKYKDVGKQTVQFWDELGLLHPRIPKSDARLKRREMLTESLKFHQSLVDRLTQRIMDIDWDLKHRP